MNELLNLLGTIQSESSWVRATTINVHRKTHSFSNNKNAFSCAQGRLSLLLAVGSLILQSSVVKRILESGTTHSQSQTTPSFSNITLSMSDWFNCNHTYSARESLFKSKHMVLEEHLSVHEQPRTHSESITELSLPLI